MVDLNLNTHKCQAIFLAHIGSMDAFARGLLIAQQILDSSDYKKLRKERYASFDASKGKEFEMAS